MMKLSVLQRVASRVVARIPRHPTVVRPMSGLTDRSAALLQELQQNHYTASHASDGSRGGWDKPKSKQEMEQLHNLYHKIDALETELAGLKEEVRVQQRIFAVEAPDG